MLSGSRACCPAITASAASRCGFSKLLANLGVSSHRPPSMKSEIHWWCHYRKACEMHLSILQARLAQMFEERGCARL